ncbi:MAG: methionyl-tRNA formyltransferase [Pseudomonadota bacterium]
MTTDLSIVFAGTPDFAAIHLQQLLSSGFNVSAVYTQPDRPAGRGKKLVASPVKQLALQHEIPVYQPVSFKEQAAVSEFAALQPDLMVVVAYGLLLPKSILDIPKWGCVNSHASLLPRWRGAAPIQRAIESGDSQSGVCLMQMDEGLDTGPVLATHVCPIEANETGGSLHDKLAVAGADLMVTSLPHLFQNQLPAQKQTEEGIAYAHKLAKNEGHLDWALDATSIDRKIRAFNPWPVTFSHIADQKIRIWQAELFNEVNEVLGQPGEILSASATGLGVACGRGAINITHMQLPGGKVLAVKDILNARKTWFEVGACFLNLLDRL